MIKINKIYILSTVVVLLSACSSVPKSGTLEADIWMKEQAQEKRFQHAENVIDESPDWFLDPSCDIQSVCATASAVALDMQLSIDKAIIDAKYTLADKLQGIVSAKLKLFVEQSGNTQNAKFNEEASKVVQNTIKSTSTAGYEITKRKIIPTKNGFRAFVLAQYPLGSANKQLVAEAQKNEILNARMRASKAFADLEAEISSAE